MPKPTFQFRLRKDPTTYYYVDAGIVTTSATPVNLKEVTKDWNTLQLNYRRHSQYHGIIKTYSPEQVQFVKDSADILRYLFTTQGDTEADVELEIYKLNPSDQLYYPRGVCTVDFGKYKDTMHYVITALIQGGMAAKLQSFDTTDFAIPIGDPATDPDSTWLWISGDPPGSDPGGVMLLGSYNYQSQADGDSIIQVNSGSPFATTQEETLGVIFINEEGAYSVIVPGSPLMDHSIPGTFDNTCMAKAIQSFDGTLTGNLNFTQIANLALGDQNILFSIWAKVYNVSTGALVSETHLWTDPYGPIAPGTSSTTTSATFDPFTNNYAVGECLILALRGVTSAPETGANRTNLEVTLDHTATEIKLDFQFRQADTPCRALSHWQLFRKLFQQMTGVTYDPISDLLTTDVYPGPEVFNLNPANTYFTSGDGLRQLYTSADGTTVDPAIKTNFEDFAKHTLATNAAGIGMELDSMGREVLRCEKLEHFYRKDQLIADLGQKITNWEMYPYENYKANNLKTGYNDQKYDEVNGRYEYNSELQYKTSVTALQKDFEYKSPYRLDCYGIEYTRANLANKATTDSGSDNETFVIQSNGNTLAVDGLSPYPKQVDKAQTVTAGLPAIVWPTVFNMAFSNGRNMGRLNRWLKSIYFNISDPVVKFVSGKKNTSVVSSMYTGPTVTENADIDLTPDGTGTDLIFKPWVFEFDAEVPINLPDLVAATPYGVFGHTITRGGIKYYMEGFILECGVTDGTNNLYNFKLLCSPDTVLPVRV